MTRINSRNSDEIRPLSFTRSFTNYALGSVLMCYGHTKVLCTANIQDGVPRFLKNTGRGWLTAEYAMLPSATHTRSDRESVKGKQSGRTLEIQRLIGRSIRAVVDLDSLGERTIQLDADVIQADGGTRTAAVTGCMIALHDAVNTLLQDKTLIHNPIQEWVAAISVGRINGQIMADLCYEEDVKAEVDMNVVMTESGKFVEIQGTAESRPFDRQILDGMLDIATHGLKQVFSLIK